MRDRSKQLTVINTGERKDESTVVNTPSGGRKNTIGRDSFVQGGGFADLEGASELFLSRIKDDSAQGLIDFLAGFGIAGRIVTKLLKKDSTERIADDNIMSSSRVIQEIEEALEELDERYLLKIWDDRTPFKLSVGDTFTSEVYARLKGITEADDVSVNEAIHSKEFVSGFTAGKGWAIRMKDYLNSAGVNEKRSVAEFDDLIVRGTLKVFEFVVSQMLGENDNRTFTGMMEVDHYDKESGMVYFDTKGGQLYNPFRKDDIIIVQQYGGMPSEDNGYYITKQYELVIESVGIDWVTFRNFTSPMEGATEELIVKGDTFVRIDNLTDARRKGIMQIMTVGEDTPYMDVIYGKKTDPDNALKVRMGNLEGIYNHLFGWLKDFGAYIANLYAVGEFRIAHTGEDVSDKIEMTKGAFRTNFNQTYFDITSVDNHLKNGSFSGDMEGWVLGETDTDFLVVNGIALYANRNLMTANSKFAGRAVYNDKDMMRVRNSHIMQYNSDVKPFGYHKEYTPMDGSEAEPSFQYKEVKDKAYLSMRFHCNGSGTLEVGFDTTDTTDGAFPFTVMEVQKRVESYQLEASGIWSGEGNFVIRCSGDVYIEYVSLTDKPIDNLMVTTRTWIEQDAGRIALLGEKINNAQGTMTNLGIELNAVEERLNLYVTKTDTHESQISQLQIDTNGIRTTVASVQGTLSNTTAAANSALSKAQEALWDAQDAAYDASVAKSNAATALNQSSNAIDILAVNFDDNGNVLATSGIKTYVDGAISGIKLTADNVNINNGVVIIDKDSATIGGFIVGKHTLVNEGLGNDSYGMKNTVSLTPYDGRSVGHTFIEINAMSGGATSSAVTGFSVGIKSEISSVKDESGVNNSYFSTLGGYFEGTATSGNRGGVGVWGKSLNNGGSPYILAGVVGTELAAKTGYTKAQAGVIGFSQYNYGVYAKGGRNDLFLANASIGNFGIGELVTNATSMANFVNDYNILMSDSDATLPRCGDVPMGRMFLYINGDSSVHKVSRSGSDTIAVSTGASSVTSINVYESSAVFFIKIGYSKWYAFKAYDENE